LCIYGAKDQRHPKSSIQKSLVVKQKVVLVMCKDGEMKIPLVSKYSKVNISKFDGYCVPVKAETEFKKKRFPAARKKRRRFQIAKKNLGAKS
jgi:hypothetical protein